MTDISAIQIPIEQTLREDLADVFEADAIASLMAEGQIEEDRDLLKALHDGTSFRICENLAPRLHAICEETRERVGFEEAIAFYVTSSSDMNAYSVEKSGDGGTHVIALHSRLIEMLSEDELRFVVGHEIGHLQSRARRLSRVLDFVYPEPTNMPEIIRYRIGFWRRLLELSSDRCGYLASPDLRTCINVFFKLASGLSTEAIEFDPNAYLAMARDKVEEYKESPLAIPISHPVNPIRLCALELFSKSDIHSSDASSIETSPGLLEPELEDEFKILTRLLSVVSDSSLDIHRIHFIGSAGLLAAKSDAQMAGEELELILGTLGSLMMFPETFMIQLMQGDCEAVLRASVKAILAANPAERNPMFQFIINVTLKDGRLHEKELGFLSNIGTELFDYSKKEIAQQIGTSIRERFTPRILGFLDTAISDATQGTDEDKAQGAD